jgi:hypothetical protein
VAVTRAELQRLVRRELENMNEAQARGAAAHQSFLVHAQMRSWQIAAECQLEASAHYDAGMDAFMRACRMQAEAEGG